MNMRPMLWAVAAVVAGGVLGCGKQPEYYRVAIDQSSLSNLPSSCYTGGTVPSPDNYNTVDIQQWVVWEGVEDRKYLQVGGIDYRLGNSSRINIPGDAVVSTGDDKKTVFAAERTATSSDRTFNYRATYTFDKEGETVEGSLALSSTCTGTSCPPNCEATLPFVGRRLAADPMVVVDSSGVGN